MMLVESSRPRTQGKGSELQDHGSGFVDVAEVAEEGQDVQARKEQDPTDNAKDPGDLRQTLPQ